jgi:hypothetical protein
LISFLFLSLHFCASIQINIIQIIFHEKNQNYPHIIHFCN